MILLGARIATLAVLQDLVTIEALTAQEENAEADKLIESLQNGVGGVVNTRMCYMCFDDVDEASNPLVSTAFFCSGSTNVFLRAICMFFDEFQLGVRRHRSFYFTFCHVNFN